MIKEINFGTAIKLGKGLAMSYHHTQSCRWVVTIDGDVFKFEDSQGEFNTTFTTKANVKYWVESSKAQEQEDKKKIQDQEDKKKAKKGL